MSSRILADVLALASATSNIVKRHVEIQLQSASRAAVTSSITKAIKRDFQGHRLYTPSTSASSFSATSAGKEDVPLDEKNQDVFYGCSDSHSAPVSAGADELNISERQDSVEIGSERQNEDIKPTTTPPSMSSKPINPVHDHHIRKYSTHRSFPSEIANDKDETSDFRKNIGKGYLGNASTPNNELGGFDISQRVAQPSAPHNKLHKGINSEYYHDPEVDPDQSSKSKSVYPVRL